MLLTDWGPTNTDLFRSGRVHKREALRRLMAELPQLSWALVGDDGQHDPYLYAEAVAEHPGRRRGGRDPSAHPGRAGALARHPPAAAGGEPGDAPVVASAPTATSSCSAWWTPGCCRRALIV